MSLSAVLFTDYRRRVLGLLLLHPEQSYYLREIARLTGTVPGTLKRELTKLESAGVLTVEKVGNQAHYAANRECPIFDELASILRKTSGLADVLADGLLPLASKIEVAFVFGSMASGKARSGSDIDLMVIGEVDFGEVVSHLHPLQESLGREINPKLYTRAEWQKLVRGKSSFVRDVLGKKDGKKRFADTALAMSKAFTLCCTLDEAKAVREEVAFFQAVKVIFTKRDISQQKKTNEERELAIRQIIGSAVVSEEVVDIFNAVGLDKPDIGILDEAFLADVRNLPEKNLAVELLERLLQGEIKTRFTGNVVQSKRFSDLLSDVVTRYQNRAIETAQVIEELIAMAKKFREAAGRGEELGLTEDEVHFYDALADNESAVRELSDEILKKIAHELTENLRKNLTVDWSARESVRAKLRLMVKRILRKYKYPPDQQEAAVELVLQQAQALGEAWAV